MRGGEDLKNCLSSKFTMFFISLALVLSMFAMLLLNGSTAWFAENDRVLADGMQVKVNSPTKLVESVQYFPISSIALSGNYNIYTFSVDDEIKEPGKRKLGVFSTLEAERQLLIKINLADGVNSVKISAESEADSYIIQNQNTVINTNGNSLSSVIEFYCISDIEEENRNYIISGEDIAASVTRFAEEQPGEIPFVFSDEIDLYSTDEGEDDNSIFIILDYYELSVEYVTEHVNRLITDKSTDIESGKNVEFVCDFKIVVSEP